MNLTQSNIGYLVPASGFCREHSKRFKFDKITFFNFNDFYSFFYNRILLLVSKNISYILLNYISAVYM